MSSIAEEHETPTKHSILARVAELLERPLPLLACLSGVVVPDLQVTHVEPDLDSQLDEIFDCVRRQERRWGEGRVRPRFVPHRRWSPPSQPP